MDNQAIKVHEKIQQLIEQYSKDKKRLMELESQLKDITDSSEGYEEQITNLKKELQTAKSVNDKLSAELNNLKKMNAELEKLVNSVEFLADDINNKIDDLFPHIDKL